VDTINFVSLGGLGETKVASRLALYDRLTDPLLDHLVGTGEQRTVRASNFAVLRLMASSNVSALLNRDVSWLCALEDPSSVNPDLLR